MRLLLRPRHRGMHLHGLGRIHRSRCPARTIRAGQIPPGHRTPWGYRLSKRFLTDRLLGPLLEKIKFDVIYASETALKKEITTSDVTRPGLEMTGYLEYYTPERIQLFGMKEWSYAHNEIGDIVMIY